MARLACLIFKHRWVLACERAHDITFLYCLRCKSRDPH